VTAPRRIRVDVVYALPAEQILLELEVEEGSTVEEAIEQSGILRRYPDIDSAHARVGIFGKPVRMETRLCDGDRVEIYRPLIADPKEARRARTRRAGTQKRRA
jgi:putative ubiquitin-RnfH superfamily antitoxin RatB of RatAB toxin-antitoxin module